MKLTFQLLREGAAVPVRATASSAGLDLTACLTEPVIIPPHEIRLIPTGLAAAPDRSDVMLMLCARSGLAAKHGIGMANGVGIVDADYRGEICVPLINQSSVPFEITGGMRIAQLIAVPVVLPEICTAETLLETARGTGGFGSTGIDQTPLNP
ncbi:MAG: dUTP diphosphatase [Oscillospiraceae bacterium]|nr:dUTP diphosphatase [Oscillospiraceae bacterium]